MSKPAKSVFSLALTAFAFSAATLLIILLASAYFMLSAEPEPAANVETAPEAAPAPIDLPALQSEGLPEPAQLFLKTLVSIAQGDAEAAAAGIDYPIARPHPLSSVDCAETFIRTFPILFDAGARAKIAEALQAGNLPERVGWRGYLFLNGELWASEDSGKIYTINIDSEAEREEIWQQMREEKNSLHPDLQTDLFESVFTFVSEEKGLYGRIDRLFSEDEAGRDRFRVAVFTMDMPPSGLPKHTFICRELVAGTACNVDYLLPDETSVFSITRAGPLECPPYQLNLPAGDGIEEIPVDPFPWPVKK